jgi:hypothetical protein
VIRLTPTSYALALPRSAVNRFSTMFRPSSAMIAGRPSLSSNSTRVSVNVMSRTWRSQKPYAGRLP